LARSKDYGECSKRSSNKINGAFKINIFVVEENQGVFLGYIQLGELVDSFTNVKQGFIDSIAITKEAEGKGIGKALINFSEDWVK
jgi:ribosomal protein S18 acetylase RimI-like enzyme